MKKNIFRNFFIAVMVCMLCCPINVFAQQTIQPNSYNWHFSYQGSTQELIAPYSGTYRIVLRGAQGGDTSFSGGYGGEVVFFIQLKKGDKLNICVGGKNGYNGGGKGVISNGGGATSLYVNEKLVAIAGGGGGATMNRAGGNGGDMTSGNNGVNFQGNSSDKIGSAGGGGGFAGGKEGIYYNDTGIHSVTYYWNASQPSDLYGLMCRFVIDSSNNICCNSPAKCKTKTYKIINSEPYDAAAIGKTLQFNYDFESGCDHTIPPLWSENSSYGYPNQDNTSIVSKEISVLYDETSYGGSSWVDTNKCTIHSEKAGVVQGNGEISIILIRVDELYFSKKVPIRIYYNNKIVKKSYFSNVLVQKAE